MFAASKLTPRPRRHEKTPSSSRSNSGSRERLLDPVRVFCRLRPLKEDRDSTCVKLLSPTVLVLSTPSESKQTRKELHYSFNHIFTSYANQKEIFERVAFPAVEDLLKGKNGLLFTYGVTGSGKTYTLTGDYNNPGIMPRGIYAIFNSIENLHASKFVIKPDKMNGFEIQAENDARKECLSEEKRVNNKKGSGDSKVVYTNDGTKVTGLNETIKYAVFVSYVEIYNNVVYDLLDESSGKTLQAKILREDARKNMYVNGVSEIEVKSAVDAFGQFNAGQRRKRMGHTILNAESSRSHSIFNIRVVQLQKTSPSAVVPEQNHIKVGQLSFVDLAGSERASRTQNTGVRLKEASSINNSLLTLRSCLEILRENQMNGGNRLVPYRDSRLTLLFKNYFEGDGLVQMIVCLNPSVQDFEENLHVVKFAELSQDVKVLRAGEMRYTPYKTPRKFNTNTPSSVKVWSNLKTDFGPKVPMIKFNLDDPEGVDTQIMRLFKVLRQRKQKSDTFECEFNNKVKCFRKRLLDLHQSSVLSQSEIRSLKALLKKETTKNKNLETKICNLETQNDDCVIKVEELEDYIRNLQNTIDEKNLKINQNVLEKQKFKQKQTQDAEKITQELDTKLHQQRELLKAQMLEKENKLQKVREVLDDEVLIPSIGTETENSGTQTVEYGPRFTPLKDSTQGQNRQTVRRLRSRSASEVWLEHNSVKPVALGTVLQPTIRKRKSVSKLSKATDVTNPKQNKYCLIAQDANKEGELETKVYKGDILPTCGGGAQVIFNDVERLRQESPTRVSK